MTAYPCGQCGATYTLNAKRRTTRYCPACRLDRKREKAAANQRRRAADKQAVQDVINQFVQQGMDLDYITLMAERPDGLRAAPTEHQNPLRPMPPLPRQTHPAGPDEGASTYFTDLRGRLDHHAIEVARHPWWAEHPNWHIDMNAEPEAPAPWTAELKAA